MYELYNADSLAFIKAMTDKSVDLLITDPPYNLHTDPGGGSTAHVTKLNYLVSSIKAAGIGQGYDFKAYNDEFCRILKKINVYVWTNKVYIPMYFTYYVEERKCKFDILCWHKTNTVPTYAHKYLTDTEYCLYFRDVGMCDPHSYTDAKTFYVSSLNIEDKKKWGHPTIKPLAFTEAMVRNSSKAGDTVLDPFMGSGTTGVAAVKNGRKFIGIEIQEEYFKSAERRLQEEKERQRSNSGTS
jgi:adenine-specific DNA methyltransferase